MFSQRSTRSRSANPSAAAIDSLESRRLMSITYDNPTRTYTITGTSGDDLMYAAWRSTSTMSTMRLSDGTTTQDVNYPVGPYLPVKLVFSGGDGKDTIDGAANVLGFTTGYTPFYVSSLTINGDGGNDTLFGSNMGDTLNGSNQNDELYGDGGDDLLQGGNHNDFIYGGSGNDILYGQSGTDHLQGDSGSDLMNGGTDIDTIFGSDGINGNDTLDLDFGESYTSDPLDVLM